MTMQETVAANVRARLAWSRVSHEVAAQRIGRSVRAFRSRLAAEYPFRPDELATLADLFGMDDVGAFFRVPEGFAAPQSVVMMNWGATVRERTCDFALAA